MPYINTETGGEALELEHVPFKDRGKGLWQYEPTFDDRIPRGTQEVLALQARIEDEVVVRLRQ